MNLPRLRAPQDDGQHLIHPGADRAAAIADENRERLRKLPQPLSDIRLAAAGESLATAESYFRERGEPLPVGSGKSLFVAGHQPDLFHPGVWFKNFALQSFAVRHGATPLNLIVDNDVVKSTSVRIPNLSNDPTEIRLISVPYDDVAGETVFEERVVHHDSTLTRFPARLAELTASWPFRPLGADAWLPIPATPLLGERLAAIRRAFERRWGLHNFELPLSRLCATESFARFAHYILGNLPDVRQHYNAAIGDYRRRHGIRNAFHPVPDLGHDGDWLEAPFWTWRRGQMRRSRLFVSRRGGRLNLRAGGEAWPDLPVESDAVAWRKLEADGFKIRTRALTTTLFARLCLSDLFLHGIGGGKYDEVTDQIIQRCWHIQPPGFMVVTGTLRLPLPGFAASQADWNAARRLVRDLEWNPQRHLSPADAACLELIESTPSGLLDRKRRYEGIRKAKSRIRPGVEPKLTAARTQARRLQAEVEANEVLRRRDYSFVLYPEAALRKFLTSGIGS